MKTQVHTQLPPYAFPRLRPAGAAVAAAPRRVEAPTPAPQQAAAGARAADVPAVLGYN